MSRLIDADALWMDVIHSMDYCDDILEFIERQPTIEPGQKKGRGMQKRKVDELISYFNRKVSDMDIDRKYKMELLGMITAIGLAMRR